MSATTISGWRHLVNAYNVEAGVLLLLLLLLDPQCLGSRGILETN